MAILGRRIRARRCFALLWAAALLWFCLLAPWHHARHHAVAADPSTPSLCAVDACALCAVGVVGVDLHDAPTPVAGSWTPVPPTPCASPSPRPCACRPRASSSRAPPAFA